LTLKKEYSINTSKRGLTAINVFCLSRKELEDDHRGICREHEEEGFKGTS
jgi:hypothetical protein